MKYLVFLLLVGCHNADYKPTLKKAKDNPDKIICFKVYTNPVHGRYCLQYKGDM